MLPVTGRLEAPSKRRPHNSYRIRVNGRQRRHNLETADAAIAEQKPPVALADIKAELAAKKEPSGTRARQPLGTLNVPRTGTLKRSRTAGKKPPGFSGLSVARGRFEPPISGL
jgi:hypothetical protein